MPRSIVELSLKMMKEAPSLTCITIWDGFSRKQEEEDDGRETEVSNGDKMQIRDSSLDQNKN